MEIIKDPKDPNEPELTLKQMGILPPISLIMIIILMALGGRASLIDSIKRSSNDFLTNETLRLILGIYITGVFSALPLKLLRIGWVFIKFHSQLGSNLRKIGLLPDWMSGEFSGEFNDRFISKGQGIPFLYSFISLFLSWIYVFYIFCFMAYSIYKKMILLTAPKNIKEAWWRLKHLALNRAQAVEEISIISHLDAAGREQLISQIEENLRDVA